MKKIDRFGLKFAIVALGIGLFSPSVTFEATSPTPKGELSYRPLVIDVTLFNGAEARPVHRQARRVSRRTSRRTSRRVSRRHNVAYGGGRYYGGGYYAPRPHPGAAVAAGAVAGMAVGAAVAAPRYY